MKPYYYRPEIVGYLYSVAKARFMYYFYANINLYTFVYVYSFIHATEHSIFSFF